MKLALLDLAAQRRRLDGQIEKAVARVLEHGRFVLGPEVLELETQLAEFAGVRHAISCANGTDALQIPLMAWGIGAGDAVFVPAFTFVATAEAVALVGATPVFVDVRDDTFNMDPESLAAAIEETAAGPLRPAAVIPVDLFGQPAEYDELLPIAEAHGIKVLADTAQSFGARYQGRRVGPIGDAAATSFYPAKPLGCYGDGGAVFTDDDTLAAKLRSIREHGAEGDRYRHAVIGMNSRLDTIQAAVLLEKLKVFEDELTVRQRIADRYSSALASVIETPRVIAQATSSWAQYTLKVPDRDRVAARLKEAGVPTAVYYPLPLHRQQGYRSFPVAPTGLATCEGLPGRVVSLPMHPDLDEAAQSHIVESVIGAVG